jgi:ATP-dependent Lon protease
LLTFDRRDAALGWLHAATEALDVVPIKSFLDALGDRAAVQAGIIDLVDHLYATGTPSAGALALAWQMLTADPRKPESFRFLPQLQCAIDHADLEAEDDADVRARIRVWWRAAEAEWLDSKFSIFHIAAIETRPGDELPEPIEPHPMREPDIARWFASPPAVPTLVVMPKDRSSKLNNFHSQYKDLVDAALPLVVVRDVARIRAALHAEFPHAAMAVDLLLRDLRDQRPFSLKPVLLVGDPGSGKSRLVRRLADLVRNLYVYRFDAASSSDSHFGGTSKAWGNTEPSVPFRAVAQGRIANPVVFVDEVDKASKSTYHGRLVDSILPFCDVETARRYRDQSLDCEIDISMCSFIATANDATALPSPLKDRFRIVKVPSPTLAHLPQLAAQVMRDLAIEDEARQADPPLATDELAVIAKAWAKAGFSMRKLQKIVGATLEARDSYAPRH